MNAVIPINLDQSIDRIDRLDRWDNDEDRYVRIRMTFAGLISNDEAVRTFARFRYAGAP